MNLARPYAEALFATAGGRAAASATAAELDRVVDALASNAELRSFLVHEGIPVEAKKRALDEVFASRPSGTAAPSGTPGTGEAPRPLQLALNFVQLIVERRRLGELGAIARALRDILDAGAGESEARVEAARALTPVEVQALTAALERRIGSKVRLAAGVRPELIGGLRVIVGDKVFDGSVRGEMESLRRVLAGRG